MTDQSGRKAFEYNVQPISDDQLYDLEVSVAETHSFGLFVRHDFYAIMARLRAAEAAWLDPAAVHVNLVRSRVLTRAQLLHLLGDDMQSLEQRAVAAEAERDRMREALKPFAEFAAWATDEHGWSVAEHRAAISTWFGPSDFRHARKLVEGRE